MSMFFLLQAGQVGKGPKNVAYWEIIEQSNAGIGWLINLILFIMFGYTIFVFVERFLAIQRAAKDEQKLLEKVKDAMNKIQQSKDDGSEFKRAKEEAVKICDDFKDSPIAGMLRKGIERVESKPESIASAIENKGKFEILRLEQRLNFLATASGAAPMIGFLGTVVGMVVVFIDLQNATSLELRIIAPGIMTAMITTVEGLIVGIIAFMGYNFLVGKIGKVIYQMENAALEFMDLIPRNK
jgi:biopolymer transport protein ExbB